MKFKVDGGPSGYYEKDESKISDGGPSGYYDFPPHWTTLNDYIEYKSKWNWKEHSFHIANIVKATCRWGDKSGTTIEYDVRKIIYSAARVYKAIMGTKALRDYLTSLLEDKQFQLEK